MNEVVCLDSCTMGQLTHYVATSTAVQEEESFFFGKLMVLLFQESLVNSS